MEKIRYIFAGVLALVGLLCVVYMGVVGVVEAAVVVGILSAVTTGAVSYLFHGVEVSRIQAKYAAIIKKLEDK